MQKTRSFTHIHSSHRRTSKCPLNRFSYRSEIYYHRRHHPRSPTFANFHPLNMVNPAISSKSRSTIPLVIDPDGLADRMSCSVMSRETNIAPSSSASLALHAFSGSTFPLESQSLQRASAIYSFGRRSLPLPVVFSRAKVVRCKRE